MNSVDRSIFRSRVMLAAFTVVTLGFVGYVYWAYREMPEKVPVHFGFEGKPDRWSGKTEFLAVNFGVAALMFVCFGVGALLIGKIPPQYINLPNKEYWLAPGRRRQAVADINFYYVAMGILTIGLMWWIAWGAFQVAVRKSEVLPWGILQVGIYLLVEALLLILMILHFARVPER